MNEVTCVVIWGYSNALTRGRRYAVIETDEAKHQVRVKGDNGRTRWFPAECFDRWNNSRGGLPYTVWIEAEEWAPGQWNPINDNSDVIVTFADGTRWVATFFSYNNVASLTAKNRRTGECLSGRFFWASDMILVDEVSRRRIEELIAHLLDEGHFEHVFSQCREDDEDEDTPT